MLFTKDEMRKLVMKSSSAFSDLDPAPTWLLKECIDVIITPITQMVNLSLHTGVFPDTMKVAHVKPLLKKHGLDNNNLKNYRPVSNLSFMSKLIERAVAVRVNEYVTENNLAEPFQSAYKSGHSTETALLRVKDDIMLALDNKQAVILVLLDLSAAFDTVDFGILLARLEQLFGFTDTVLCWFKSYLTQRSQLVSVGVALSEALTLQYGVPQGSVLGPLLFVLYTRPLGDIARRFNTPTHMYADDTQLYATLSMANLTDDRACVHKLEQCISNVKSWMASNWLKLNDDKTDMICLASHHFTKLTDGICVTVGDSEIACSQTVVNLGVTFDRSIKMDQHVTAVCGSSYFHLRNIRSLKPHLTPEALITVTHAFISSRIDYCNSLLYGIADQYLQKLQRIQNCAARIITNTPKYDHITPVLKSLHWLPVKHRVTYKILLLVYKAQNGLAPIYLSELVTNKQSIRQSRSSNQRFLIVPKTRLKTYGDASFRVAGPTLWNALPLHIKTASTLNQFKSLIKTHLRNYAFNKLNYSH